MFQNDFIFEFDFLEENNEILGHFLKLTFSIPEKEENSIYPGKSTSCQKSLISKTDWRCALWARRILQFYLELKMNILIDLKPMHRGNEALRLVRLQICVLIDKVLVTGCFYIMPNERDLWPSYLFSHKIRCQ